MSFLAPFTLIGLALLALPILIHLLVRRRAERLDFPSLRYLRETPSFRLRPRHIRQPLLLALRALALALVIIGLAHPYISRVVWTGSRTHVILLDASLSMRASSEAARERARVIINNLGHNERAAIIAFSSAPVVLTEFTADRQKLLEAVASYSPTKATANYRRGLAAADTLLRREQIRGAAQIDLVSDFQQSGLEGSATLTAEISAPVVPYAVGEEVERNAFLFDEALVTGTGAPELSATEISSEADGRKATRRTWTINSTNGSQPDIEWRTESNGQTVGSLKAITPDDFDADDERFFALTPTQEKRALLIETKTDADLYLRAALETAGSEKGTGQVKLDVRRELPQEIAEPNRYTLVVLTLHGAPRLDEMRVLMEYARGGGTVWALMGRDLDAASWNKFANETEEGRALAFASIAPPGQAQVQGFGAADLSAPALRSLNEKSLDALRAVRVRAGFSLTPRADAATLIRWNDNSAALVSRLTGRGAMLLMATSAERAASDFGASASLPALASSILRATAGGASEPLSTEIGAPVYLDLSPETLVTVSNPSGQTQTGRARDLVMRPEAFFTEQGIYRVEARAARRTMFLAINTPVAESERALASADEAKNYFPDASGNAKTNTGQQRERAERGSSSHLWRYFLAAAFLLLIVELFLSLRRSSGDKLYAEAAEDSAV
jgi:hypothetical protein